MSREEQKYESCVYCGFKTALREQQGDQLPACSLCVLTKDLDAKGAVARLGNVLLRELNELRLEVRRLKGEVL